MCYIGKREIKDAAVLGIGGNVLIVSHSSVNLLLWIHGESTLNLPLKIHDRGRAAAQRRLAAQQRRNARMLGALRSN